MASEVKQTKFTPGPWVVVWSRKSGGVMAARVEAPQDRGIPGAVGSIIRKNGIGMPACEIGKANARLIAAAPDLYEACFALVRQLEDAMASVINERGEVFIPGKTDLELKPDGSYLLSQARAALAKAIGARHA